MSNPSVMVFGQGKRKYIYDPDANMHHNVGCSLIPADGGEEKSIQELIELDSSDCADCISKKVK